MTEERKKELKNPCARCEDLEAIVFNDDEGYCNSCIEYLEARAEASYDSWLEDEGITYAEHLEDIKRD